MISLPTVPRNLRVGGSPDSCLTGRGRVAALVQIQEMQHPWTSHSRTLYENLSTTGSFIVQMLYAIRTSNDPRSRPSTDFSRVHLVPKLLHQGYKTDCMASVTGDEYIFLGPKSTTESLVSTIAMFLSLCIN